LKRGYMIIIGIVVVVAALFMFLFRVNEDQVIIERMLSFDQAVPKSQVVLKDRESIRAFEYAFRFGKKQQGKVDIDFPPYTVTLGKERYFLYIYENYELANFMKASDTETLYRISKSSTKKLQKRLKNAYSVNGSGSDGAADLPSPREESPSPMPSSDLPNNEAFEPAYLDSSAFSEEEKPLIDLINLRIKYIHEENWKDYWSLYTDNVRKERESDSTENYTSFTITSINAEQDISIKEQKSLFEAVVRVTEVRNNEDGGMSSTYVFQRNKEKGAEWRIADVD